MSDIDCCDFCDGCDCDCCDCDCNGCDCDTTKFFEAFCICEITSSLSDFLCCICWWEVLEEATPCENRNQFNSGVNRPERFVYEVMPDRVEGEGLTDNLLETHTRDENR